MSEEKNLLNSDRKIPLTEFFKQVFKYIKPEIWRFVLAFILMILNVAFDIFVSLITSKITGILKTDYIDIILIAVVIIGGFIMFLVSQVFMYFDSLILQKSGQNIIFNLRKDVFSHIENMSLNQLNEMPVGSLVTRVASYTEAMSDLFTNVIVNVVKNVITIVAVFCVLLGISPKLGGILSVLVFLVFLISFFFSKYMSKLFRADSKIMSDMNTFLNENISGIKLIQNFNQEEYKHDQFNEKNNKYLKNRMKIIRGFAFYRPLMSFLYFISVGVTFYFGIKFGLNSAEIVAFYLLLSRFFNPVQELADQLNNIQKSYTSSEKLFNLMNILPDVVDKKDAIEVESFKGKIEFKNVWFAYEDENWILKDVSFVVNPKESCAFVGATGAGKTTILSLIVRNYEPQKGEILIDDINVKDIKIESLRKAIGQMLQDVFLFSGSIRSNITLYDNDSYSDDEIMGVCEYVNADTFINKLPNKLDEEVIEKGENFSVGQRQLLSFARTVLSRPQILILDEATANIDTETEVLIQASLQKIKSIGTMLVVAHRLSTIQHSDQIIVLQNGKIVEKGTHQDLLKNHGYYYKLYELQFSNK